MPGRRRAIIAVASGKGGVGKSTTAVNLALGLRDLGLKVGVLDADIYGPSLPKLLAIKEQPQTLGGTRLKPIERYGLTVMSIGFLIEEETPMIWRGPMVMSALTQMLREVEWGTLDVMVVDMPPGTGDAQLTMAQQVPLKGAVIVSTPQDLALIDARRGIAMFQPRQCAGARHRREHELLSSARIAATRSDIFGHGGARQEAERLGVPFLGEVPLRHGDPRNLGRRPAVVATQPDGPHAAVYRDIAERVRDQLELRRRRQASAQDRHRGLRNRKDFRLLSSIARNVLVQSGGLYVRALLAAAVAVAVFFALSYVVRHSSTGMASRRSSRAPTPGRRFAKAGQHWSGRGHPAQRRQRLPGAGDVFAGLPEPHRGDDIGAYSAGRRIAAGSLRDPTIPTCLQLIAALERPDACRSGGDLLSPLPASANACFAAFGLAVDAAGRLGLVDAAAQCRRLACWCSFQSAHRGRAPGAWRDRGFAAIAAMLLLFDGLWLFGIYFSLACPTCVLAGFLAMAYHHGLAHAPEPKFATAVAWFGVATAAFELLTGGIPFGLALLLGVVALDGPADATALLRRAWHGSVIFVLAILVSFVCKLALVTLLLDPQCACGFSRGVRHAPGAGPISACLRTNSPG